MLRPWSERAASQRVLATTAVIHLTNDACFALLYPLLPLIAADLHLTYGQVGLIKAVFSGAQSLFQVPVGVLGERWGDALVLLVGNAWVGVGLGAMALAGTYLALLALSLGAGLGGNAQHPLGSAMVSRAFHGQRAAMALGTLNFAGDLGKLLGPLVVGVIAARFGWRLALAGTGAVTALISVALLVRRRVVLPTPEGGTLAGETTGGGHGGGHGFPLALLAGGLDSASRGAALTFLPFLLARHGLSAAAISLMFSAIFAAGAAGKFVCGWLGDRWGPLTVIVVTELTTAVAIAAFPAVPLLLTVPLALLLGFALNGTSSALLAIVARLIPVHRHSRGYGIFFTASLVSSAAAPLAYGVLADHVGLTIVFLIMAAMTAVIVVIVAPLARVLPDR